MITGLAQNLHVMRRVIDCVHAIACVHARINVRANGTRVTTLPKPRCPIYAAAMTQTPARGMAVTVQPSADKRGGAALCCRCGNLRTEPGIPKNGDENHSNETHTDRRGWRATRTLDCRVCGMPTCHAVLLRSDRFRDSAEEWDYERRRTPGSAGK